MFKRILIPNRGEIAVRIHHTCRTMGIQSVAIYTDPDRDSFHVQLADQAYYLGKSQGQESYLDIDRIVSIAKKAKVDAVHPGYGFLSENVEFAKRLRKEGIAFIGPSPENIETMGDKLKATHVMKKLGIPILPSSKRELTDIKEAQRVAKKIGYPVAVKASFGGGGRGIRFVDNEESLIQAIKECQKEGELYFKNKAVFIEKYISRGKHIEIQILGDSKGNPIHLFERDCSVQRRHQKILEEAPASFIDPSLVQQMIEASLTAAKHCKYTSAGTMEFLVDLDNNKFYFLEMNTRIQVEHPVTEMITGIDIVRQQILIAQGKSTSLPQSQITKAGHAIELRICAEDPSTFVPSPGTINRCRFPSGPFVRVDNHVFPGYEVSPHYDPTISKVITWGRTRNECMDRLKAALDEFLFTGVKSNIVLHKNILRHPEFIKGGYDSRFLEREFKNKPHNDMFMFVDENVFLIAAAIESYKKIKNRRSQVTKEKTKPSSWRFSKPHKSFRGRHGF